MKDILKSSIVGLGYFGKNYARLLRELDGVMLHSIANRSSSAFEKYKEFILSTVRRTTSAEEVFRDPEVDCVVIATPPASHFLMAKAALERGKHVLLEKPMVTNLKEAQELERIVRKSGCTFMVGHQYLYHDHMRYLKKKLEEGWLGKVRYLFAEHLSPGPIRSDIGCFWEMATHELAVVDYLFRPERITNASGMGVDMRGSGREDFAAVEISLPDGVLATIVVSWFAPEKVRRLTLVGEKGMVVFDDREAEKKLKFFPRSYPEQVRGESYFMERAEHGVVIPRVVAREPLRNEMEHFIDCIRNRKEPLTGITHGVRVTRHLDMISKSITLRHIS